MSKSSTSEQPAAEQPSAPEPAAWEKPVADPARVAPPVPAKGARGDDSAALSAPEPLLGEKTGSVADPERAAQEVAPTRVVTEGTIGRIEEPPLGRELEPTPETTVRTLTQEEVNRLLGTTRQETRLRLLKELGGFESAEQAKAALGALADATARAQAAEETLAASQAERAEVERTWKESHAGLQAQLAEVQARAAVYVEASRMGFRDPSDAYHMLDRAALGTGPDPAGAVHEALEALATSKPYLLLVAPGIGVTNPGRQERAPESDGERRRRLYGTGGTPIGRGPGGGVFMPEGYRGST